MGGIRRTIDKNILGKKSDYKLAKELDIPRTTITSARRRQNIIPYKKRSDLQKIEILKKYLENNRYKGIRKLYSECEFNRIFGSIINLPFLKNIIDEFEIKVTNDFKIRLDRLIKREGRYK